MLAAVTKQLAEKGIKLEVTDAARISGRQGSMKSSALGR
jgi:hypothetical protein